MGNWSSLLSAHLETLFDGLLPDVIGSMLAPPLGEGVPRLGGAGLDVVSMAGRFTAREAAHLLTDARQAHATEARAGGRFEEIWLSGRENGSTRLVCTCAAIARRLR